MEETLVTIIAVAIANNRDGICATNPSPIDNKIYVSAASSNANSCCVIPIIKPPIMLIAKIKIPATASPLTNFDAPSIAP